MSFSIAGKTAIITGAANGCGLAIGRHFIDEGANVVFADIDEAALRKELGEEATDDSAIRLFAGDLREKLAVANLLSETIDAFDRVDILINAARQIRTSDPLDATHDNVESMLAQNLMTPLRMSQAVAKQMIQQSEGEDKPSIGTIVNLSSIAARRTHLDLLGYSVAAAGVEQMTRSLAVSLAPHHIRVNTVAFGSVMSASLRTALRDDDALRRTIIERTPLHRIANPRELAHAVQYLASDASSFVTGQVLTVDGGRTLIDPVAGATH